VMAPTQTQVREGLLDLIGRKLLLFVEVRCTGRFGGFDAAC